MVNEKLLKAKIIETGYKREELACILGITLTTFNYKINNEKQFKANEIMILSKVLGISRQKDDYFFAEDVGS